jgi:hypothetical protein
MTFEDLENILGKLKDKTKQLLWNY